MNRKRRISFGPLVIAFVLTGLGLLVFRVAVPLTVTAAKQLSWTQTECVIDSSELLDQEGWKTIRVAYHYSLDGAEYRGTRYALPSAVSPSDQELRDRVERLKPGITVPCWFDPSDVHSAVLARESLGNGFLFLIPLVLFTIAYFALRSSGLWPKREKTVAPDDAVVAVRAVSWGRYIFFGLFIMVGLGTTYLFFGRRYLALQAAQGWEPSRCVIASSRIDSYTSTDSKTKQTSTSYEPVVSYSYTYSGKRYMGNVWNPAASTYSSYEDAQRVIDAYPAEQEVDCFVDPKNPFESALSREYPKDLWFGLFPLIFSVAGLLGLAVTSGEGGRRSRARGGQVVRKSQSRVKGLFMLVGITIVWNGIVGAVSYGIWDGWSHGDFSIFPLLIVVPFALIGALLIAGIPYAILQLFNPSLDITVSDEAPEPGTKITISWRLNGNVRRVRRLDITLEFAARQNEDSRQKGSKIALPSYVVKVTSTDRPATIEKGTAQVMLPSREELALRAGAETGSWSIKAVLSIPWYPDAMEVVPLRGHMRDDQGAD